MPAALLRDGARVQREGGSAADLLGVLDAACGGDGADAVARGARALDDLPVPHRDDVADPGGLVRAAAVTAAVASGVPDDEHGHVVELAGCLAVVGPPAPAAGADLRAGHALVAAWLAVHLHQAGLHAPDGAAAATAATVLGTP